MRGDFAHRKSGLVRGKSLFERGFHVFAQQFVRLGNSTRADHKHTIERLKVETRLNDRRSDSALHEIASWLPADLSGSTDPDEPRAGQKNNRADLSSDPLTLRKDLLEPCFGWTLGYHAALDRMVRLFD